MAARKNPAAVALGRLGGKKGGPARMDSMTEEQREEFARMGGAAGSKARWEKYYREHPEKLKARQAREAKKKRAVGKKGKVG